MGIILKKDIKAYQAGGLVTSFKVTAPIEKIPVFKVPYDFSGAKTTTMPKFKDYSVGNVGIPSHVSYHNAKYNYEVNEIRNELMNLDNSSPEYAEKFQKLMSLKHNKKTTEAQLASDYTQYKSLKSKDLSDNGWMVTDDGAHLVGYTESRDKYGGILVNTKFIPISDMAFAVKLDKDKRVLFAKTDDDGNIKKDDNGNIEYVSIKEIENMKEDDKNIMPIYIASPRYVRDNIMNNMKYHTDDDVVNTFLTNMNTVITFEDAFKNIKQISNIKIGKTFYNDIVGSVQNFKFINDNGHINIVKGDDRLSSMVNNKIINQLRVNLIPNQLHNNIPYLSKVTTSDNINILNNIFKFLTDNNIPFNPLRKKIIQMAMVDTENSDKYNMSSEDFLKKNLNNAINDRSAHYDFVDKYLGRVKNEAEAYFNILNPPPSIITDDYINKKNKYIQTVLYLKAEEAFEKEYNKYNKQNNGITDDEYNNLIDYINLVTNSEFRMEIDDLKSNIGQGYFRKLNLSKNMQTSTIYGNIKEAFLGMANNTIYDQSDIVKYNIEDNFNKREKNNKYKKSLYRQVFTDIFVQDATNVVFSLFTSNINISLEKINSSRNSSNKMSHNNELNIDSGNKYLEQFGVTFIVNSNNGKKMVSIPGKMGITSLPINKDGSMHYSFINGNGQVNTNSFNFTSGEQIDLFSDDVLRVKGSSPNYKITTIEAPLVSASLRQKILYKKGILALRDEIIREIGEKINGTELKNNSEIQNLFNEEDVSEKIRMLVSPFLFSMYLIKEHGMNTDGSLFVVDDKNNIKLKDHFDKIQSLDGGTYNDVKFVSIEYNKDKDGEYLTFKRNNKKIKIINRYYINIYKAYKVLNAYNNSGISLDKMYNNIGFLDNNGNKGIINKSMEAPIIEDKNGTKSINFNNLYASYIADFTGGNNKTGLFKLFGTRTRNDKSAVFEIMESDIVQQPVFIEKVIIMNEKNAVDSLYDVINEGNFNANKVDSDVIKTSESMGVDLGYARTLLKDKDSGDKNDLLSRRINAYCKATNNDDLKDKSLNTKVNKIYESLFGEDDSDINTRMAKLYMKLGVHYVITAPTEAASIAKAVVRKQFNGQQVREGDILDDIVYSYKGNLIDQLIAELNLTK